MDEAEIMKNVLYISFVYPPNAIEHEEDEAGIIRNYDKEGELTGLTIVAAKRFAEKAAVLQSNHVLLCRGFAINE